MIIFYTYWLKKTNKHVQIHRHKIFNFEKGIYKNGFVL